MRGRFESLCVGMIGALLMSLITGPLVSRPEATYDATMSGMIAHFNLTACPAGWSEFTTARGLYIVGRVLGGTLNTPVGSLLGDQENRAVGLHAHTATSTAPTINDPGHSHALQARSTGGTNQGVNRIDGLLAGLFTQFWDGSIQGPTNAVGTGITVNAPAITVANAGTVGGTNAPYIALLTCKKN